MASRFRVIQGTAGEAPTARSLPDWGDSPGNQVQGRTGLKARPMVSSGLKAHEHRPSASTHEGDGMPQSLSVRCGHVSSLPSDRRTRRLIHVASLRRRR